MHPNTIKQAYPQLHAGFKSAVKELVAKLSSVGYADTTVTYYEQGAVHFSFWLAKRRISPSQIKQSHFTDFLSHHPLMCECPFGGAATEYGSGRARALRWDPQKRWLSDTCRSDGDGRCRSGSPALRRVHANTAGLQDATRLYRRRYVQEFLDEFFPNGDIDVSGLAPKSIVCYLAKRGARLKAASTSSGANSSHDRT
jgi:hypothetical protein